MLVLARRGQHAFAHETDPGRRFDNAFLQFAPHLLVFLFHRRSDGGAGIIERFGKVGCGDFVDIAARPPKRSEARTARGMLRV